MEISGNEGNKVVAPLGAGVAQANEEFVGAQGMGREYIGQVLVCHKRGENGMLNLQHET